MVRAAVHRANNSRFGSDKNSVVWLQQVQIVISINNFRDANLSIFLISTGTSLFGNTEAKTYGAGGVQSSGGWLNKRLSVEAVLNKETM